MTGRRLNVVAQHGARYLLRLVRHDEDDAATEIARTACGARPAVKFFEHSAG